MPSSPLEVSEPLVLDRLGQITNPIIAKVDPHCIVVHVHIYVRESINCEHRQFAINRYSQLKSILRYQGDGTNAP